MEQWDQAIVAFAAHDADEANALCLLLGKAGWPTLRRRFSGSHDDAHLAANLANARCLIVLWSASTASLQRLHFAAERAHRVGALIPLRLDDGAHPADAGTPLDFTGWPHKADLAVCETFLHAVAARLGPPPLRARRSPVRPSPSGRGPAQQARSNAALALRAMRARQRKVTLLLGGVAAGAIAALTAAAVVLLDPNGGSLPIDNGARHEPTAAIVANMPTGASEPLRGLQPAQGSGLQSRATERMAELEANDWLQVRAANDAEHALVMLSKFRAAYPNSRHAEAAAALEADWRVLTSEIQAQLVRLGYAIVPSDGLLHPQTRASVRAFQARLGIMPDGKMDRALLMALQAATPRPAGPRDPLEPAQKR